MQQQHFAAGATIFSEGDASDRAYLIRSGRVDVLKRAGTGMVRLAVLGPGDIVGEMGLLEERPRSATARALEPVVADAIDQQEFTRLLLHEPQHAFELLQVLFERLRTLSQRMVDYTAGAEHPPSIPRVAIVPLGAKMRAVMPAEGVVVTRFPFNVGRKAASRAAAILTFNELEIPDKAPYVLSPSHFALDLGPDGVVTRDRGSQHGTIVNGARIGAGTLRDLAPLHAGTNEIVAAAAPASAVESPFRFRVTVEAS